MKSMKIQIIAALLLCIALFSVTAKASVDNQSTMTCNPRTSAYNCMVCNCYHEARDQVGVTDSLDGLIAVTKVVLSRVESPQFPNSVCKVVYQRAQFSWTGDKYDNNIHPTKNETRESVITSIANCKRAVNIAQTEGANGILYYFNPTKARPKWARKFKDCGNVGSHKFMVDGKVCPRNIGRNTGYNHKTINKQTKTESSKTGSNQKRGTR